MDKQYTPCQLSRIIPPVNTPVSSELKIPPFSLGVDMEAVIASTNADFELAITRIAKAASRLSFIAEGSLCDLIMAQESLLKASIHAAAAFEQFNDATTKLKDMEGGHE